MSHTLHHESILTNEAAEFINEWNNSSRYVKAHTSGTTGTPKDILLLKDDMRASARATIKFFGINSGSTIMLPLSPDYIAGKMQIVRAIEAGCKLITEHPSSHPFQSLEIDNCDLIPIVPSQIEGLLKSPIANKTRNIIIGGAPLSPLQEHTMSRSGIRAFATYGMTETCSHVALRLIGDNTYRSLPGFTFSIDSRGCLVIDSSTLSCGRLTTNDMVKLISTGEFEWLGRYDNVINSGGIKIHPEKIERILQSILPAGVTAYVTSRKSQQWGEEAVIVTDNCSLTRELLQQLRQLLPQHHTPHDIIHVSKIQHTTSGKIIRQRFP